MSKPRNEVVKYECLATDTMYAFTYSPADNHQFWGECDRYQQFKAKMNTFFMSILKVSSIQFRYEVSPHGRLHLHGYIKGYHKMDFFLFEIPKIEDYGTLVIKEITEPEKWVEYCTKQHLPPDDWYYLPIVHKPLTKRNKRGIRVVFPPDTEKEKTHPKKHSNAMEPMTPNWDIEDATNDTNDRKESNIPTGSPFVPSIAPTEKEEAQAILGSKP